MSPLEVALTVFVWGCIPGGALLVLFGTNALLAYNKLAAAKEANERRLGG